MSLSSSPWHIGCHPEALGCDQPLHGGREKGDRKINSCYAAKAYVFQLRHKQYLGWSSAFSYNEKGHCDPANQLPSIITSCALQASEDKRRQCVSLMVAQPLPCSAPTGPNRSQRSAGGYWSKTHLLAIFFLTCYYKTQHVL